MSTTNKTETAIEITSSTTNTSTPNVFGLKERRSKKLIDEGLDHFSEGEVNEAIKCFKASLDLVESAEGYTNLGWMLSFSGQLDIAIDLCKKAISLDPDFGNPYNDIGTYFMKKGELEKAVPWLERAKEATRYIPKHYPFLNLGRIYLSQGMFAKALREFEGAVKYDPENTELLSVINRLRKNHGKGN